MATFTVTNTNDSGSGSLRDAVQQANDTPGTDSITFNIPGGTGTLTLTSGELAITDNVTIDGDTTGDNVADVTISGNSSRIFSIDDNSALTTISVTLDALVLRDGNSDSGDGGAVFVGAADSLTLNNSEVTNN